VEQKTCITAPNSNSPSQHRHVTQTKQETPFPYATFQPASSSEP
jgi:hypothetical protein